MNSRPVRLLPSQKYWLLAMFRKSLKLLLYTSFASEDIQNFLPNSSSPAAAGKTYPRSHPAGPE